MVRLINILKKIQSTGVHKKIRKIEIKKPPFGGFTRLNLVRIRGKYFLARQDQKGLQK